MNMATRGYSARWVLAIVATWFLVFTQEAVVSSRLLAEESPMTTSADTGRSLLQTCWPGMRVNCPPDMQVECEVGGVGGCDCVAMASCVPQVSGCFVVVDGMAIRSCGF